MKRQRRAEVPSGDLISLGSKAKRPPISTTQANAAKKLKTKFAEIDASDLVSRVDSALNTGNTSLAESLLLSALNELKNNAVSSSVGTGATPSFSFRSSGIAGSRLLPGMSLGMLILAQSHPNLFTRQAVFEQMITILSLRPREVGISLPPNAVTTIAAPLRGLHVLIANLLYFAYAGESKWPSKLVKIYLEDSLTHRVWVDQDECRAFVLNLETAFPKTFGDPRGLFTVLSNPAFAQTSSGPNQNNSSNSASLSAAFSAVSSVLGLNGNPLHSTSEMSGEKVNTTKDDIAEAVATAFKNQPTSVAKLIHGSDVNSLVTPRFETHRAAVEVIIVNTLREALGRRSVPSGTQSSSGNSNLGSTLTTGQTSVPSFSGSSIGDAMQLRNLIRTLAMGVGIPELRGLIATKLEPWLTNPKLQYHSLGLFALLAVNCRLGGLSAHDLDLMISCVFRIRYKLLKPMIQVSFLECIHHLIKASPMNLYCIVHLCAAGEIRSQSNDSDVPTTTSVTPCQSLSNTVLKIAETVRALSNETGDGTVRYGSVDSQNQLNTVNLSAVAAGASNAASRSISSACFILPMLYQRTGSQWIRIVGDLLHERLILAALSSVSTITTGLTEVQFLDELHSQISPLYQFLRDLARWTRSDSGTQFTSTTSSNSTSWNASMHQQYFLPCGELALALLQDRSFRGATTASAVVNAIVASFGQQRETTTSSSSHSSIPSLTYVFQFYLNGVIALVSSLQMISATRPFLSPSSTTRRTNFHLEATRAHHSTLRQIRLGLMRWIKTLLPLFLNAASTSQSSTDPQVNATLLANCLETIKPSTLIRRSLMLDSATSTLSEIQSRNYQLGSFYPVRDIWLGEQDYSRVTRLVTDTSMPEKLAHQLLLLGLEPNFQPLHSLETVDIICDLIWRAAMFAADSGLDTLEVTKPERLLNLLYASCTYMADQTLPEEMAELAHASSYWKVCLTAVILAARCPRICGLYLWSNYPTIKRLMEMVISNDFTYSNFSGVTGRDSNPAETEKLNHEMELQLISRLESHLSTNEHCSSSEIVSLKYKLIRNNPCGPCRYLPDDQLNQLKILSERLNLGRGLWSCRDPDFLLEMLHNQINHMVVQPWLMRLVESSDLDTDLLPVQCLCEYLLCHTITQLQSSTTTKAINPAQDKSNGKGEESRSESSSISPLTTSASATSSDRNKRVQLIAKLQKILVNSSDHNSVSDALSHSFLNRLRDSRRLVREAVRQCLKSLLPQSTHNLKPGEPKDCAQSWLLVLETLNQLPALSAIEIPYTQADQTPVFISRILLDTILASLQVENDLDILTAHLHFLGRLTHIPGFDLFQPLIAGLTQMILTRPQIVAGLLHRFTNQETNSSLSSYTSLEAIAEIFVRYVDYCCTAAEAILIDEKKSIFVAWSIDRQYPFDLEFIEAQLVLLTHTHEQLPTTNTLQNEIAWWMKLRDLWFIPDNETHTTYNLPMLTPFSTFDSHPESTVDGKSRFVWFENSGSCDNQPRLTLSIDLRCNLLQTNQSPLVHGALGSITDIELAMLVMRVRFFILTESTLQLLKHQIDKFYLSSLYSQIPGLESKLSEFSQYLTALNQPRKDLPLVSDLPTDVKMTDTGKSEESQFEIATLNDFSKLEELLDNMESDERQDHICRLIQTVLNQGSENSNCEILSQFLKSKQKSNLLQRLLKNPNTAPIIMPLIVSCVSSEFTKQNPQFKNQLINFLKSLVPTDCHGKLASWLLLSINCPIVEDEPMKSYQPGPSKMDLVCTMDCLRLFGLAEVLNTKLFHNSTFDSDEITPCSGSTQVDFLMRNLQHLVFDKRDNPVNQFDSFQIPHNFFVAELLNQANPQFLRQTVSTLLRRPESEPVQPSCVLDFITALFTLPRLSYPVPRAEPRDRPDEASALPSLHRLEPVDACNLINYILIEGYQSVTCINAELFQQDLDAVDSIFRKRAPIADLAIVQYPRECLLFLELICGFLECADSIISSVELPLTLSNTILKRIQTDSLWSHLAYRLLVCLYLRRPGLASLFHSRITAHWVCHPHLPKNCPGSFYPFGQPAIKGALINLKFPQLEFDRLGPLLLVGLTSSNQATLEMAQKACKSLFVHHSRACLHLIPMMAALSEGRLDTSWTQFSNKRYHHLFTELLHLLEILCAKAVGEEYCLNLYSQTLCPASDPGVPLFSLDAAAYGSHVDQLLTNLIAMLSRFRSQARRLSGFPKRLAKLLRCYAQMAPWRHNSQISQTLHDTTHTSTLHQLESLVEQFEEFSSISNLFGHNQISDPDQSLDLVSVVSECRNRSNTQWGMGIIQPFLQQLRSSMDTRNIISVLNDLENVSNRKTSILLHFKSELERLIGHPDETISSLSVRLLLKLLDQYPTLAPDIVLNAIVPCFSTKLTEPGIFSSALLDSLPDICLLVPNLAPHLLHLCAEQVLFASPNETTHNALVTIESTIRRLSLDGLDGASIEHAASALMSHPNVASRHQTTSQNLA